MRPIQTKKPRPRHGSMCLIILVIEVNQSADFADTDFSDDDLDFDGFDSDDDDLDSVAGFDSLAGFDDVSLDNAALPLVAGVAGVDAESDSVLLGVLFLA
jgi:hypothetical protein